MTIRKLLRKRKPIMRQFILNHDPRFPKPGQKVMFAYYCLDGAFRQKVGTYYPGPARIVMCSGMMYRGIPVTETIPFEYVTFWAPFRGEGMRKHVKTRKVKV
jgi:hypothetical protein